MTPVKSDLWWRTAGLLKVGLRAAPGQCRKPQWISEKKLPPRYRGQLRNRHLSVAAARFVDQLVTAFVETYDCD